MKKKVWKVPEPTLRRLPLYYHYLKGLLKKGREAVSCTHIGTDLNLDPPQIRKDLAFTGIRGIPKVGYKVSALVEFIERFFGWNKVDEAFLVGTGNLGKALIGYEGFSRYGFKIVAAFDANSEQVGKDIKGVKILDVEKLADLSERMNIKLGVIAVPENAAQGVADELVKGGVKGIWNFAPAALQVPDDVIVQNENIASGLAVLSKKLQLLMQDHTHTQEVG